ncbi:MAG: sodium:calcium antiporter [Sulfuricaulis sp.]
MTLGILVIALLLILIGAEIFTNALEHLGERLGISDGVTGSIFAAIGTAMPETMVPLVALISTASTRAVREEVGVGAILGAPLMLSTLTMFLIAVFAVRQRGWQGVFQPERSGLTRDLLWFLLAFGTSSAAIFVPHQATWMRILIALLLVLMYLIYLGLTFRASAGLVARGHGTTVSEPLLLVRLLARIGVAENMFAVLAQLGMGLGLIIFGAHGFVQGVEQLSERLGISALVLSLLIVPVATELPEKINSILWIRRRKDTLAFSNVTGAMVFQGSLLPAIGILLTPWEPRREVMLGLILTIVASSYLLLMLRRGQLRPVHLVFNGVCYLVYLISVFI